MRNKDRTETWRKVWLAAVAFFFFVLLVASFFGERGWVEIYKVQKRKQILETEIANLTQKKQKLEKQILDLQTNPEAVEKKAREKLWMMKPDELVLIKKQN